MRRPNERRTSTPRSHKHQHRDAQTPKGIERNGQKTARLQHSQKRQKQGQQTAGSMSETPSTREDQEGARVPMTQGRRQRPTPHAPPRTRDARARTHTTPCSGRGCEIAWIKGLMMLQKSNNLLGCDCSGAGWAQAVLVLEAPQPPGGAGVGRGWATWQQGI